MPCSTFTAHGIGSLAKESMGIIQEEAMTCQTR